MTLKIEKEKLFYELNNWAGYQTISNLLDDKNTKIYLAGGAVRNSIIGIREIKDFDFFIKSEDKTKILTHLGELGFVTFGPFGSARWHPKDVTDVYCDLIWINEFNNGLWKCEDIIDVLNQFDFTANAIAFDINSGVIFNPENGIRDIEKNTIRAVRFDYPNEPISANSLLID